MAKAPARRRGSSAGAKDAAKGLELPADLRIAACPVVHEALLAMREREELALDAGAVTRVDATGLQLLVAACRDQRTRGGRVTWLAVSEPLRSAALVSGLSEALSLQSASS